MTFKFKRDGDRWYYAQARQAFICVDGTKHILGVPVNTESFELEVSTEEIKDFIKLTLRSDILGAFYINNLILDVTANGVIDKLFPNVRHLWVKVMNVKEIQNGNTQV